jgi:hypothetical protein
VVAGFSPLDEALDLPAGQLTPLLAEWVVHLGSWVPFGQVPRLLELFAGVPLSRESGRRHTEAAGALLLAHSSAPVPALAPPADPGPATNARLQLSADGVMVRLQRGDWVEVKTVAIGQVPTPGPGPGAGGPRSQQISYYSRHASAEEFTRGAVVELHRRGVRRAAAVAGVTDGALWLQGFLDYHRPDAVRILDLPHAAEHLGALGAGIWGEGSATAQQWQARQVAVLREHGAAPVVAALAALAAEHPDNGAIAEHGEYLRRRVAQMDYPGFRAAGWPIGSGMVESGNKLVVEARLKGAGMGWAVGALNPMLSLRDAVCNDRWAEAWAGIGAERRRQNRGRRRAEPARQPPPAREDAPGGVNPVIVAEVEAILDRVASELAVERAGAAPVAGKPGPRHPWRRAPLRKAP